jgi:hypothetical protein
MPATFPVAATVFDGMIDMIDTSAYQEHNLGAVVAVSCEHIPTARPRTNDVEGKTETRACKDCFRSVKWILGDMRQRRAPIKMP